VGSQGRVLAQPQQRFPGSAGGLLPAAVASVVPECALQMLSYGVCQVESPAVARVGILPVVVRSNEKTARWVCWAARTECLAGPAISDQAFPSLHLLVCSSGSRDRRIKPSYPGAVPLVARARSNSFPHSPRLPSRNSKSRELVKMGRE
jgi:hypothetical protein